MSAHRADFREGNVEKLPFEAASFGKVCTVNTIYFWRSLDAGFADVRLERPEPTTPWNVVVATS